MDMCGLASHRSGYRSHRVGRQPSRFVNLQRVAFIGEVPCLLDKLRAAGLTSFLINGNHQGRESELERDFRSRRVRVVLLLTLGWPAAARLMPSNHSGAETG